MGMGSKAAIRETPTSDTTARWIAQNGLRKKSSVYTETMSKGLTVQFIHQKARDILNQAAFSMLGFAEMKPAIQP